MMPQAVQRSKFYMQLSEVDGFFKFSPNTREQNQGIAAVYEAAQKLAEVIAAFVPDKHAKAALGNLAQVVTMARQGIEIEPVPQEKRLYTV
jgi:hypothetical protein